MKIKHLLLSFLLIAASCATEEPTKQDPSGPFTRDESVKDLSPVKSQLRTPSNGISCEEAYAWKQVTHSHSPTSASTATTVFRFWPDRAPNLGPNYDPLVAGGKGTYSTVLTIRVENRGQTPIKFSINNGVTWTAIDRGGAPAYYNISVPRLPVNPYQCASTEAELSVYSTVMFKSTGCPPMTTFWQARVNVHAATNGAWPYYGPGGGMSIGFNWNPPSYPCSFTL